MKSPAAVTGRSAPLFVFDTHPIQYRSPVFREIYRRDDSLKVFFFNSHFDSSKWWFNERSQIPAQNFGLELNQGFPNQVLETSKASFPKTYFRLLRLLEESKPRAVLTYGYYQIEHWCLWLACRRLNIPLLFVGESFSESSGFFRRAVISAFLKGVDTFISIGKRTYEHYRRKGVPEQKIVQGRYCVDTQFFNLEESRANQVRKRWRELWNIPQHAKVVLFVGRLVDRKRPHDVVAIHRRLRGLHGDLYTCIIGNGILEQELRRETQADERLFFTGFQNQAELRDAYYGADLLLVTSTFETWGLVVNEAFACGLPAAVTDTCGVANDLVLPGETGLIFPVGQTETAARELERLFHDEQLWVRMRKAAKQKVTADYRVDAFAEVVLKAADVGKR